MKIQINRKEVMEKLRKALEASRLSRDWKPGAVDGFMQIVAYGYKNGYSTAEIAFNISQAEHETSGWLQPIREGCRRQGPAGTDDQAIRAIQAAIRSGLIKSNYLTKTKGVAHYGRGLIQITWIDNYLKFEKLTGKPLVAQPDLALEWYTALFIMYKGINAGLFRKVRFKDYVPDGTAPTVGKYASARNIINGDAGKYGSTLGARAMLFYNLLKPLEVELQASTKASPSLFGTLLGIVAGKK